MNIWKERGRFAGEDASDAARLALQSAVAAVALFVAMQALGMPEKFVGILSAVLVVQPSLGNTLVEAWDRVLATLAGSLIGVLCLVVAPGGYGVAIALAVSMLVMNAAAAYRPDWRYGVVAAVALSLSSEHDVFQNAQERFAAISMGAAVGVLASLVVWPQRASERADRQLRRALVAASDRLDAAVEDASDDADESKIARASFHSSLQAARTAADGVNLADGEALRMRIDKTDQLYNSVLILRRAVEEAVDVVDGDPALQGKIESFRESGSAGIRMLSHGEQPHAKLEKMQDATQAFRRAVARTSDDPDDDIIRSALVFGLEQVHGGLRELSEAYA